MSDSRTLSPMKLSVSLTADDVAALDRFVEQAGLESRSAGVQQAIRRLRDVALGELYEEAWREWSSSGEGEAWAITSSDGLRDASR